MTLDEAVATAMRGDDKYKRWPLDTLVTAAAEITRLRAVNAELVEALEAAFTLLQDGKALPYDQRSAFYVWGIEARSALAKAKGEQQ